MVTVLRMITVFKLANVFTLITIATVFKLANVLRMITVFTLGILATLTNVFILGILLTWSKCSLLPLLPLLPHMIKMSTLAMCSPSAPLPHMITLVKCVSQKICVTNLTNNKHHATATNHPKEPISSFLHHRHTRTTKQQKACVEVGKKRIKTA